MPASAASNQPEVRCRWRAAGVAGLRHAVAVPSLNTENVP